MKNFRTSKPTLSLVFLAGLLMVSFQNFTPAQKAEFEAAKNKLQNLQVAGLYEYCAIAGTVGDKRPASRQFKCNELPFGKLIGMSPVEHAQFLAQRKTAPNNRFAFFSAQVAQKAADENLALWHTKKEVINQDIPFTDKAGKSRSVKLSAYLDRAVIETKTDVVLGNADFGIKNYGQQRIFKPQGHHFSNVNKDNYTLSTCTYFPGMKVSGDTMGSKYSLFDKWWGSYSVHFSINPGNFKFDRFETCNLLKINKGGNQDNLVQLIGLKSPKFLGAQLSGLAFDVDIGIFGWFVTVILATILHFIPFIGTFLSAALVSTVFLVTETNIPANIAQTYMNKSLDSYDTSDSWNKILNNFNSSEANIKSGGYLKDLVTISMLKNSVIPAFKEQIEAHSKIEYLRTLNPSAVAAVEKAERDVLELKLKAEQIELQAQAYRDSIESKLREERDRLEAKLRAERDRFRNKRSIASEN